MNSTEEPNPLHDALGALFDDVIVPLAERMRQDGRQAFPTQPDVSWLSYYVRRKRSLMLPSDFTSAACADVAELEARLRAHWESLGRDELAGHAARFAAAARPLAQESATGAEVSPYVYAMF